MLPEETIISKNIPDTWQKGNIRQRPCRILRIALFFLITIASCNVPNKNRTSSHQMETCQDPRIDTTDKLEYYYVWRPSKAFRFILQSRKDFG